jgi:D-alanyl-D-alanine carboxypeptidase/D-alanyl-D-alanine-endopeptidase (penicillin-binding protein 4)
VIRVFALTALLSTAVVGCAKAPPTTPAAPRAHLLRQLQQDIIAATRLPGVQRAVWGVVVHSLSRDERVFELNPRTLLVPASVAKIVSTAAAADAVGWDYRFETTLRGTGPIVDGTLQGDLLVVGGGDPSIGGRAGDDLSVFVDALRSLGVRRIAGDLVGDDNSVEEPRPQLAWAWDDLGYATGATFGALNFGENRMTVTVGPGPSVGGETRLSVEPDATARALVNRSVTGVEGSPQLIWPEQRPEETALTIAGSIPVGAAPARLGVSVGNPTLWFARVLLDRLVRSGIEVTGEARDVDDVIPQPERAASTVHFTYRSHPLADIVQPLLKDSINLYAEAVLRLNAARDEFPTNDAALDGLRARLRDWDIPEEGQQLVDGSGLSRRDVVSAEALVTVLRRVYGAGAPAGTGGASPLVTGLPVAGVDGSLAGRMVGTAAHGNVRAKTGTMSNIRSLAGYVTTRDNEPLAFAIMVNNFEGDGAAAVRAIDAIAVRLAEFRGHAVSETAASSK